MERKELGGFCEAFRALTTAAPPSDWLGISSAKGSGVMPKTGTIEVNGGQCATAVAGVIIANPAPPMAAAGPVPAAATRNACKLCAPLGACVVFSGLEGCVPFLHGSQGCATYIRRYLISHFREPVDIGSSSFSEEETVFGGAKNL